MKSVAIITARGGSKRIPKKNIKDFCGKPIIQYSIEAARECNIFDEIMVSTDDLEIKEIAEKLGAKVPFIRTELTSNDTATTYDVLLEVLQTYKEMSIEFDYMCCIYPTAPFITAEKLIHGMRMVMSGVADAVLPVVQFSFPPQRGIVLKGDRICYWMPDNELVRSQDLEKIYHDCGQFYCLNVKSFFKEKKIVMQNSLPMVLSELEMQDIDNEEDWKIAELKYMRINRN